VLRRRLILFAVVPVLLLLVGTFGYYLIEWPRYTLFDGLYMTVITLTTVGYEEIHNPLSTAGRVFTILLLLGGVFLLFYMVTDGIRFIVSGELHAALGKQRMEQNLAGLRDHLIVCGYGRMGRYICKEFSLQKAPFVLIERNGKLLEDFSMPHGIALHGDATVDEVLQRAGVERARALVTVAASDADNLYITMSARLLNEGLYIVARAESEHAEQKLMRAGANRVVSPYVIGGSRVAMAVLRPTVVDFLELATRTEHLDLQIEETQIGSGSSLAGVSLQESRFRRDLGVIVVAIKKSSGHMLFNPPAETVLEVGDILIAVGNQKQLRELDRLASG
jgi:voltage-gated potassium channel